MNAYIEKIIDSINDTLDAINTYNDGGDYDYNEAMAYASGMIESLNILGYDCHLAYDEETGVHYLSD